MLHQYDHRWATYDGADTRELTDGEKRDPNCLVMPRYWVGTGEVRDKLGDWQHDWLLGWRRNARNTDERTMILSVLPAEAIGDSVFLFLATLRPAAGLAMFDSFIMDYAVRQKVGGTNMSFYFVTQFPVLSPAQLEQRLPFLVPRVLELTYTAIDLAPFARDLGHEGEPFQWNPQRRALIRAELDAAMFRLYGIEREDVEYVMETFPIVKRNDERRFGEYRTKRLILERYDAMVAAEAAGVEYDTPLNPPPGDPTAAHASPAPAASI